LSKKNKVNKETKDKESFVEKIPKMEIKGKMHTSIFCYLICKAARVTDKSLYFFERDVLCTENNNVMSTLFYIKLVLMQKMIARRMLVGEACKAKSAN